MLPIYTCDASWLLNQSLIDVNLTDIPPSGGSFYQTQLDTTVRCAPRKVARPMFGFLRRGPSPRTSLAIQQALVQQGLPFGMSVNRLRVLTRQGNYAGRSVRYFLAFDADQAAQGGLTPRTFKDLDTQPDLVVGSGHIERDGAISLTRRQPPRAAPGAIPA